MKASWKVAALLVLGIGMLGVTLVYGQQGGIIVTGADAYEENSATASTGLTAILTNVRERLRLEYPDRTLLPELVTIPTELQTDLATARERIVMQYPDRGKVVDLPVINAQLQARLNNISDRLVLEYPDRTFLANLAALNTQLATRLNSISDRIIIQYADRSWYTQLRHPNDLPPIPTPAPTPTPPPTSCAGNGDCTISGRVFDYQGHPFQNLAVGLYVGSNVIKTHTDSNGAFVFPNLYTGSYTVVPSVEGLDFSTLGTTIQLPPNHINLIFNEAPPPTGDLVCQSIAQGMNLCQHEEQTTAVIDLNQQGIRVALAYEQNASDEYKFKRKLVPELVAANSPAGGANDTITHPYVAVNGTGLDCEIPLLCDWTSVSMDSLLSIDGIPFGLNCTNDPSCFQGAIKTSFFAYLFTGSTNQTAIRRARVDFGCPNDDCNGIEQQLLDLTSGTDFAVGYGSSLLDADPQGKHNGTKVSGFPEYVPNDHDHQTMEARTAIGISCNGNKLFLSTIVDTKYPHVSTARWIRNLYKQGACRVVMLDGGRSTQFSSAWNGHGLNLWGRRDVINSIVVFNESVNLRKTEVIPLAGKSFFPSERMKVTFDPATFDVETNVVFAPQIPNNLGAWINVNVFYQFEVSTTGIENTGHEANGIEPNKPYEVVLEYDQRNVPRYADEDKLALYYWNGSEWELEPTSVVDTVNNTVTAHPQRFGRWALLTKPVFRQYLPVMTKR